MAESAQNKSLGPEALESHDEDQRFANRFNQALREAVAHKSKKELLDMVDRRESLQSFFD
ncbi:hypothetical protein COL26b_006068 [Colletotrichum chrysophilum]|uniref:uncharacterized protein n=1 Tax=Colletotrichum chrysophilum TaxID=1836956 RepID=UPI0022FFF922|nr:uncharacterized protein COL26b_006068 [Colletotrichum chrysophilum]KAJ0375746.1 hypothetical protein COL26b_006068 [Colletotrichum chrysophilum]